MSSVPAASQTLVRNIMASANAASSGTEACTIYGEGDALYCAMLSDIAVAESAIRLESYIFAGDEIGWMFAKALAERARGGVRVQLHLDGVGTLFEGTSVLLQFLVDSGVQILWFNRWRWLAPLRYNRRNHRKLLVVDDRCFYIGGFNLHRESSFALSGTVRWRDVHVRLTGRLSVTAAVLFDDLWMGLSRRPVPVWAGEYRLVPNATRLCRHALHCMYVDAIADAEHHVYIATPYFVPDGRIRNALAQAAQRGVDVRVLLPARYDNWLVDWVSRAFARGLEKMGVRFFEYLPRMLHSKIVMIDGAWATIGSTNTDYRSFFVNSELNLVSRSQQLCRELERLFAEDLTQAREISANTRKTTLSRSIGEFLGQRIRRWL